MKASFPTAFDGVFMGRSRNAGEFQADDDRKVTYGEQYLIAFESSEGLAQTVAVTKKSLEDVGIRDPESVKNLTPVKVIGDVVIGEREGYTRASFKPVKIDLVKAP